jgi:hypothetical protein
MRTIFTILSVIAMFLGLSFQAHAELYNRGTDINGNRN